MKKVLYFLITILLFSCKVNGQIGTVKTEEYKAEFEKKQSMTVVSDYTDTIVIPIQVLQIGINETVYEMYPELKDKRVGLGVANIVLEIDKFMIAQYLDISKVAYYSVAIYISTLITVPRRSLFQIANPLSAKLLNEKKFTELNVLYKKSSLNLLIVCGFVFLLIVYNLNDIYAFIPENYKQGYYVVLIISFTKIYNAFLGNVDGIIFNSIFYDKIVFIGVLLTIATIYLNYLLSHLS